MTKDSLQIDTYSFDDFKIEVVTLEDTYEAWLYHPNVGIKEFMFGLQKKDFSYDQFMLLVERNLLFEDYIDFYVKEYMNHED